MKATEMKLREKEKQIWSFCKIETFYSTLIDYSCTFLNTDFISFYFFLFTEKKETLFRGNTLATKLMDQYMKMVAIPYLQNTIKGVILKIMESRQNCEVSSFFSHAR